MGKVFRITTLLTIFAAIGITAAAQDLGTSNKLFGGAKPAAEKPAPKTSSKPKTATKKAPAKPRGTTAAKTPIRTGQGKTPAKPAAVKVTPDDLKLFETLINDGNKARDTRSYAASEAAYRRAHETVKSDSRAMFGLGNIYSDQQRWQDAESAYRSAIAAGPERAYQYIALSYVLTQPVAAPDPLERYQEAERLARKAIQLDGSSALAYDQLGVALESQGLLGNETESAYRRAIELMPFFAPAHAHLGRLFRRKGLTADSSKAYADAVAKANDPASMILVAGVMQSDQRWADSLTLLQRAVVNDEHNVSALFMLARALIATRDYSKAEVYLLEAAGISPNSFLAHSLLGTLYTRQGKLAAAENSLMQASRTASAFEKFDLASQFEAVGDGYMLARDARGAERAYKKALGYAPGRESLTEKLRKAERG